MLGDSTLEVVLSAVGERPLLKRVPAGHKKLPPAEWEQAYLPINQVLMVVSFRRCRGNRPTPRLQWVMGTPPRPSSSSLELLRLELAVPPATKQVAAEKLLRTAVRRLAERQKLAAPPNGQLRQVQASHGSVFALLGVPRADARAWLQGSGFGGLLARPFWVSDGSNNIQRSDFEVFWLRSCSVDPAKLWEALSGQPGFYGVVSNGAGLELRVPLAPTLLFCKRRCGLPPRRTRHTSGAQSLDNAGGGWGR